ncbi:hypothetical protein ABZP36_014564 [Zizania latifolia]
MDGSPCCSVVTTWYKWDNNEKHLKPETGLLQIRSGLGVFANLRPAAVLPQFEVKSSCNVIPLFKYAIII